MNQTELQQQANKRIEVLAQELLDRTDHTKVALEFAKERLRMFLDVYDDVIRIEARESLEDIERIERGEEPQNFEIKPSS